ncbi:MAG: hypothetical protein P9M14_07125 [Candidatus Alcyoniella australis]|nr:hypothetical protein [Candidatus Alcyoniella australis]
MSERPVETPDRPHNGEEGVYHVSCPGCGGTLARPQGAQIIQCDYCKARCLVRCESIVPRVAVMPRLTHADIRAVVTPLLTNYNTPEDMIDRAVPKQSRLFFVPYFEIAGKKGSVRRSMRDARWTDKDSEITLRTIDLVSDNFSDRQRRIRRGSVHDMVVSLSDFYDFLPASSMPGFGVEHARVGDVRGKASDIDCQVVPFDPVELASKGIVVGVTRSISSFQQAFDARIKASSGSGEVQVVESRSGVVYYPLYRVILSYAGRDYPLTIDAVTGDVISARLPESGKVRAPMAVGFSLWVGMSFGLLLRLGLKAFENPRQFFEYLFYADSGTGNVLIFGILGSILILALTLLFLSIAWDHVRYEGEYVVRGSSASFERIGRPEKTLLDKLSMGLSKALDPWFYREPYTRIDKK